MRQAQPANQKQAAPRFLDNKRSLLEEAAFNHGTVYNYKCDNIYVI